MSGYRKVIACTCVCMCAQPVPLFVHALVSTCGHACMGTYSAADM